MGSVRRLTPPSTPAAALAGLASRDGSSPRDVLVVAVAEAADRLDVARATLGPLGEAPLSAALRDEMAELDLGAGRDPDPAPLEAVPDALGAVHQALLGGDERRTRGVHYTPAQAADTLLGFALEQWDAAPTSRRAPVSVLDPACGAGAFLLAAARALHGRGLDAEEVVARLSGIDLDPLAVDVAVAALGLWAVTTGSPPPAVTGLVVGDALSVTTRWAPTGSPPELIVGNPPFGGQLNTRTARRREPSQRATGYADTAALFLERAMAEVGDGGVVALVQPLSVLAARDTAPVRSTVGPGLRALWVPPGRLFAAAVEVCAPVLRQDGHDRTAVPTVLVHGGEAGPAVAVPSTRLERHGSWAPLWAAAVGVPPVELDGGGRLGDVCRAGAGFRDEFYALAPLVTEARDLGVAAADIDPAHGVVRVVTAGLVDWATTGWGRRPATLGGRRFVAPVLAVDDARSSPQRRLAAMVEARTAPKVLVATQTRVVEAVVDPDGSLWPSVPVISVWPADDPAAAEVFGAADRSEQLWMVAAAVMAPPVTAWALLESGGTARSPRAVKLSARQVLGVPLPRDRGAWAEGARLLREATGNGAQPVDPSALSALARALTRAHGLARGPAEEVQRWWLGRHPQGGSPGNYR